MEKILAMQVAAQLTQAACSQAGGSLPVSPDLQDPTVRAKNLHVWETFRVFYRGVSGALADNTSWPAPKMDISGLLSGLPGLLSNLLTQGGPLADIVKKLLAALPTPPAPHTGPLPDPGTSARAA
jgi:hypothetical protein